MKMKRILIGMMAMFLSVSAMADDPEISGVMVRQRWPWSRLVDINYVLACDLPSQQVDVAVSMRNGLESLSFPSSALSGDLYNVSYGMRRIVWDPMKTGYTNTVLPRFNVELTLTPVPLYMIVSLTNVVGTPPQIEYVYEADLTNGLWGSWMRNPVTNGATVIESVIWTGVATNDIYKTDKLVLRRVSAGTFAMGSPVGELSRIADRETQHDVELTKDFYAGVFEVTQEQWKKVMGSYPVCESTGSMFPVETVAYDTIRGSINNVPPVDWPTTGSFVSPTNFLGRLRANTGFDDFDLPTEAQWEYACRAVTTSCYNDGNAAAPYDGVSQSPAISNLFINALAWYKYNTGATKAHVAGQKTPNAWGLYDTHGNAVEWCRDWYVDFTALAVTDPPGGTSSPLGFRAARGGSWYHDAASARSAMRHRTYPWNPSNTYGFRLVRHLP